MTKEELEKYTVDFMNNETGLNKSNLNSVMGKMLIRYAEIFQKQIQIDAEQIRALQKQNGELTDKAKELEAQIEKMQNCRNCNKEKIEGACGHFTQVGWCKNWELAD